MYLWASTGREDVEMSGFGSEVWQWTQKDGDEGCVGQHGGEDMQGTGQASSPQLSRKDEVTWVTESGNRGSQGQILWEMRYFDLVTET